MPRSKRSGKKVTPATVKRATAKILATASMAERVRRVEAANRRTSHGSVMDGGDQKYVSRQMIRAPVSESQIIKVSRGVFPDLSNVHVACVAGYIVNGNGVASAIDSLFVRPAQVAITNLSNGAPMVFPDLNYGESNLLDIFKHFSRCRYKNPYVVVEPYAGGASTTAGCTVVVAPLCGGLQTSNPYFWTPGAITALSPASLRSSKGAIEFPAYRSIRIPLGAFLGGMDARGTYPIPGVTSVGNGSATSDVLANTAIPCGLMVTGKVSPPPVAQGYYATITFEADVDLIDFQGGWTWSTPIGETRTPADEKQAAPRSVPADRGSIALGVASSLGRQLEPGWEDAALGRAAALGDVKPRPEILPNPGRLAR